MLKTLSIRTGLLSLLAVMTLLLLIVSGIGIYALTQSSSSLQRINHLQGEQMVQLNSGYTLILRARNEAGQAVRAYAQKFPRNNFALPADAHARHACKPLIFGAIHAAFPIGKLLKAASMAASGVSSPRFST